LGSDGGLEKGCPFVAEGSDDGNGRGRSAVEQR